MKKPTATISYTMKDTIVTLTYVDAPRNINAPIYTNGANQLYIREGDKRILPLWMAPDRQSKHFGASVGTRMPADNFFKTWLPVFRANGGVVVPNTAAEYNFNVTQDDVFNFQRVLNENAEHDALIIEGPGNAIVALSNKFLARFEEGDDVLVDGELLAPMWGFIYPRELQLKLNPPEFGLEGKYVPTGWRSRCIDLDRVSDVANEIKAAREYTRKIKITVKRI